MKSRSKRIIVKFKPIPNGVTTTLDDLCKETLLLIPNGALVRPPGNSGRAVFQVDSSANISMLIEQLSKLNSIEYAEPDIKDTSA